MDNSFAAHKAFSTQSTVDDGLLADIAGGSRDALHRLYLCVAKSIYGFALSITKNTHDAEDVLQDTLLAVWQKAADYQPRGKPMAWIFAIARNCALMKLRAAARTDGLSELENSEAFSRIEDVEQRMALQAALDTLNDADRQVLLLHAVGGLKNREIAEALGLPLGTVLSRYHRAVKKLRDTLEREGISHE